MSELPKNGTERGVQRDKGITLRNNTTPEKENLAEILYWGAILKTLKQGYILRQEKSRLIRTDTRVWRRCFEADSFRTKKCSSLLYPSTLMDHNHILNTIVQALHTSRAEDVEMGAVQNNPHRDRNKGGTATIEKDRIF